VIQHDCSHRHNIEVPSSICNIRALFSQSFLFHSIINRSFVFHQKKLHWDGVDFHHELRLYPPDRLIDWAKTFGLDRMCFLRPLCAHTYTRTDHEHPTLLWSIFAWRYSLAVFPWSTKVMFFLCLRFEGWVGVMRRGNMVFIDWTPLSSFFPFVFMYEELCLPGSWMEN